MPGMTPEQSERDAFAAAVVDAKIVLWDAVLAAGCEHYAVQPKVLHLLTGALVALDEAQGMIDDSTGR